MYKIIIAGGRTLDNYELLKEEVHRFIDECKQRSDGDSIEIISGHARGADKLGERYAKEFNYSCHVRPADWNRHGRRAGYIRNAEMANEADALIAFWDGESKGTKHMIDLAKKAELDIKVVFYKNI